jgi:hypothetical protein
MKIHDCFGIVMKFYQFLFGMTINAYHLLDHYCAVAL